MPLRVRTLLAVPLAAVLLAVPIVTPVWAAPRPVPPAVTTQAIGGVDLAALTVDPPAFDPAQIDSAGPAAAARVARTLRPSVLTAQLATTRFTAAGVTWTGSTSQQDVVVQVRVREQGRWTDWSSLDSGDGPDPGSVDAKHTGGKHSTAPISSAGGEAIQVRVDARGAIPDLSLVTVDPGSSPADANLGGTPGASAHGDTIAPTIITRAQWGADESLRDCSPTYSRTLRVGFAHHTVNSNTYAASDTASIIRGIYAYHVTGRGWCDVGYQFLVDRYGQIFEGRAGGTDRPVIGAQAGGFNTDTFGVGAIGDFTTATPPQAMLDSMAKVMGWKLGLHGRDLQGRTQLTSAGGDATNYAAGTVVPVNVVSGHRDVDATDCPAGVYASLPAMRTAAASYAAANTYRGENLVGIVPTGTSTGKVELHLQSAASAYGQRMIDAATSMASGNLADWRFFVGSSMSDTRPDLIGVHTRSGSGRVDVHVASWASYYRDTVVNTISPMEPVAVDDSTEVSVGGPGGGNVYFIALKGTGSGTVEVHGLSSSSNYTQWNVHSATALPLGYPAASSRFLVAPSSADLYLVAHGATGSGRTEVHALSASSGYRSFIQHAATPNGPTDDAAAVWALGTASPPDVFFIPVSGTGSNAVEVHRLSPASGYAAWTLHAATNLPLMSYPRWQFGLG